MALSSGVTTHALETVVEKISNPSTDDRCSNTRFEQCLLSEEVDGLVMWDPWITEWKEGYGWTSLLNEPYSVLIVGEMWALGDLNDPRVPRLIALFKDAIQYVDAEADSIDAEVAKLGDWSIDTVRHIREQNPIFKTGDLGIPSKVRKELTASRKFVTPGSRAFYAMAEEWQQGFPKREH